MKRAIFVMLLILGISHARSQGGRFEFDMFSPYISVGNGERFGAEFGANFLAAPEDRICFGLGFYALVGTNDEATEISGFVPFCSSIRVYKDLNIRVQMGPILTSEVGMLAKFKFDAQYFVSRSIEGSVPLGVYLTAGSSILSDYPTDVQVQVGIGITIF